ncbi:unnamed protein product [Acanthoscelides obtectus]|uniref:Uncharacterized protein n=1 Tax=Acanthoscelides obtectus TaxID=200917 RepID=A0A9P0M640_ACAOB|nr:unnamed protein product [Acanthoscelides obtectus]CAK1627201.1 hypothetical protein AOBTE_LOCUS4385 [Acanthoscelides obtectus]
MISLLSLPTFFTSETAFFRSMYTEAIKKYQINCEIFSYILSTFPNCKTSSHKFQYTEVAARGIYISYKNLYPKIG